MKSHMNMPIVTVGPRKSRAATLLCLIGCVALLHACGGEEEVSGPSVDAVGTKDAGQVDGGVLTDAGSGQDTTATGDTGVAVDAGQKLDTAQIEDAGAAQDAGQIQDAGQVEDAGSGDDAGLTQDAGAPDDAAAPEDAAAPGDAAAPEDAGTPGDAGTPEDAGVSQDTSTAPKSTLCNPCNATTDCATPGNDTAMCADLGDAGAFCATACAADIDCPQDYLCQAIETTEGAKKKACVRAPDAGAPKDSVGTCPCSDEAVAQAMSTTCYVSASDDKGNLIGKCAGKRSCGAGGLSACDGKTPKPEACNGEDDDCDNETDELTCEDGNSCTADSCDGVGGCKNTNDDGSPCDDGDACTKPDLCKGGACTAGDKAGCDDGNPCTVDACDAKTGECASSADKDGLACDDKDACTDKDACKAGACGGETVTCDDSNPCTKDACDMATGCSSTDDNGAACDDSSACTDKDLCQGGSCAGSDISCDDGNACTKDSCDPAKGCVHDEAAGAPCDDGNLCTQNDACEAGKCTPGKAADCNDDNPCTDDSCDEKTGSCTNAANQANCDDGDACTDKDACKDGKCQGAALSCDDSNLCTDDSCDKDKGCIKTPNTANCDDADKCTEKDACKDGSCMGTAIAADACDDNNPCTKDSCNPKTGCEHSNDDTATCDDGDACTKDDKCVAGKCEAGASVCECKQNTDCKDDGNLCNGTPICQTNKCVVDPKTVVKCDPSKDTECLIATCEAKTGKCAPTAAKEGKPCADGNKCTLDNTCKAGKCADGAKATCDDGNACTTDLCEAGTGKCSTKPIAGCTACKIATDCDDKNPCTKDACVAGKCSNEAIAGCVIGPDLKAVSLKTNLTTYTGGDTLAYIAESLNAGTAASGSFIEAVLLSTDDKFDKSDLLLKQVSRPSLLPGKQVTTGSTVVIPEATVGGTYYFLLVLDHGNTVKEANETNNLAVFKVTIKTKPALVDLAASGLKTSVASYPAGGSMYTYFTDGNIGKATAPSHSVGFYLSTDAIIDAKDTLLKTQKVGAIGAGGAYKSATSLAIPLSVKPGTYYVGMWIDPTGAVYEASKKNNTAAYKITVVAAANLTAMAVSADKTTVKPGTQIKLTLTEKNTGGWASGSYYDGIYLSADDVINTKDSYLFQVARASLNAGQQTVYTQTVTLPTSTKPGKYFLGVYMDRYNQRAEVDEVDNGKGVAITVVAAPDIHAYYMVSDKSVYKSGETVKITYRERNLGTSSTGEYETGFYLSTNADISTKDVLLKSVKRASLAPNAYGLATVDVVLPNGLAEGSWYLGQYADHGFKVAESDEGNNTRYWKITVSATGQAIDLQPIYLSATGTYKANATITANFTEKNNGNVASGDFITGVYLSADSVITPADTLLTTVKRTSILAGQSVAGKATFQLPGVIKPGTWYLGVYSDQTNVAKEANETNNGRYLQITVVGTPDIQAVSLTSPKVAYLAGQTATLTFTEKNIGTLNSSAFYNGFYLSTDTKVDSNDKLLRSMYAGGLAVGASRTVSTTATIPVGTAPGTYYLLYWADRYQGIAELNENNNLQALKVQVLPIADLEALTLVADKTTYKPDETVTVTFSEKNGGTAQAGAYADSFYLSTNTTITAGDILLATVNRLALDAGKTAAGKATFKIPAGTKAGTLYLGLWVDRTGKVMESNENNNYKVIKLTIAGSPDLMALSIKPTKTAYKLGEQVTMTFYEKNTGNVTIGPYVDGFYLSADEVIDSNDVLLKSLGRTGLAVGATGGGTTYANIPLTTKPGTWYVGLMVDRYGQVAESDEKNNAVFAKITVQPAADIQAVAVKTDKATYAAGQSVTVTLTEKNIGGAATGTFYDGIYLSKDDQLGTGDTLVRSLGRASMAVGQQVTLNTSFTLSSATAAGTWYVILHSDRVDYVKELNEKNNIAVAKITVTPGPDLAVTALTAPSATYKAGEIVKLSWKVKNIGGVATTGYYDGFYVSSSPTLATGNILIKSEYRASLKAGAEVGTTTNVQLPALLDKGTWYVGLFTDRSNYVKEANEDNNRKTVKITIQ